MVQQNAVLPHFCNDRIGKIMGGNQEEVMRTRVMRGFGTGGKLLAAVFHRPQQARAGLAQAQRQHGDHFHQDLRA